MTFTFERLICASDGSGPGATSFAFGLASRDSPDRAVTVLIDGPGFDDIGSSRSDRSAEWVRGQ